MAPWCLDVWGCSGVVLWCVMCYFILRWWYCDVWVSCCIKEGWWSKRCLYLRRQAMLRKISVENIQGEDLRICVILAASLAAGGINSLWVSCMSGWVLTASCQAIWSMLVRGTLHLQPRLQGFQAPTSPWSTLWFVSHILRESDILSRLSDISQFCVCWT